MFHNMNCVLQLYQVTETCQLCTSRLEAALLQFVSVNKCIDYADYMQSHHHSGDGNGDACTDATYTLVSLFI